jgi:hypothetical protein
MTGVAGIGIRGFTEQIRGGPASEKAPLLLAKKKKSKKKKKKGEDEDVSAGGGGVKIDPNTAKLMELMVLPLVDEPTAQAIIAHRPYKTADDLIKVPEVGPSKYRIFKHLIEVKQAEGAPAPEAGSETATEAEAAPKEEVEKAP